MTRQALQGGGWFNLDSATKINERMWWNGNNHISHATGSQWYHENLWVTRNGQFIRHCWSEHDGVPETFHEIDTPTAANWLIHNHCDCEDLPKAAAELLAVAYEDTEV